MVAAIGISCSRRMIIFCTLLVSLTAKRLSGFLHLKVMVKNKRSITGAE